MKIQFSKYQGTGNDFIIIDNRQFGWKPIQKEIAALCHRKFGIGADGLMFLSTMEGFDFAMTYYNSDGNESTLCGNGGRCITAFAVELGLVEKFARFRAIDGAHDSLVLHANHPGYRIRLKMADTVIGEIFGDGIFINTGSPHFVVLRDHVAGLDVFQEGRKLRNDTRFAPGGSNIDFLEVRADGLFVRTYERGVEDETLSCGTGVTASALVMAHLHPENKGNYQITAPGGELIVTFSQHNEKFHDIWLEGQAEFVFSGEVDA
jgi:diaminopimelate epimerase